MHAAPADLSFGDKEFAVILGDPGRFRKSLGDLPGPALRVLVPGIHASGGIDADAAGRADADLAHLPADLAGLSHLRQELLAVLLRAHGRAAARAAPDRRYEGAYLQAVAGDVVGHPLHRVLVGIDVEMRRVMNRSMPSNFWPSSVRALAVSSSKVSSGMIGSPSPEPLPTTPGQGRIVEFGVIVLRHFSSSRVTAQADRIDFHGASPATSTTS
jgi:hypothetical protein